jgi:uncharacterized membrane protein SpoIIM required for sporulation
MGDFLQRNKPEWDELEQLLKSATKSTRRMTPRQLSRLDLLYRRATVHLAQVRTRTTDTRLVSYLNSLTSRAHSIIYLPPKERALRGAARFFSEGFARAIARQWRYHFASAALLLTGALLAYFAGSRDVVALYAVLPAGDPRVPGAPRELLLDILRSGRDKSGGMKFLFASFLFQHNFKVALLSLSLGMLAAIPTILLILYNGMMLGAFVAVHHQADVITEFWAWILPHGITEIGAIVLCGGMGLQLGHAVVCPGMQTRGAALQQSASEIGRTAIGAGFMLVFAAIIESYLRQSHLPDVSRLLFAAGTAIFWTIYIAHGFVREHVAAKNVADKPNSRYRADGWISLPSKP